MDTLHIYNKLLQFALFQGLSKADLGALVTHTRLGFHKYAEGDTIARAQTTCDRLFFLIDGRVEVVTSADNGSYAVAETAAAPLLFEPEALFGVSPHYASLYRALTPCSVIGIGKDEIYKLIDRFPIFRINYFNLLSALIQKRHARCWRSHGESIDSRVVDFVHSHSRYPVGAKRMVVKMVRLAQELGCSRLEVSRALHRLQNQGRLQLFRGGFVADLAAPAHQQPTPDTFRQ